MNIFTLQMSVNIWIAQSSTDLISQAPRSPLQGLCCNSALPHRNEWFKHFFSTSQNHLMETLIYMLCLEIIEKVEMYLGCLSFSKFYSHRTNLLFVLLEALQEWALTESLGPRTKSSAWWVWSQRQTCSEAEKLEGLHPFSKTYGVNLKGYLCK